MVTRFVNNLMWQGKKSVAFKVFYDALDIVEQKKQDEEKSALEIWKEALSNVMPQVEVRSRRVGGATFQRNTYSTLLPAFIDTAAYLSGVDPFLNYRSSGLETNIWTGNPTISLIEKTTGAIRSTGKAIIDDEYDFSKKDAKNILRIMPYQNMLGWSNFTQHMIDESDLPYYSE